ncbi:Oidioi.mRNA.OKI2018_I69.chr1.g3306.t1.cds [Oikopleura dioica]|uniref:Oidioi.mRNA.OKI2018_I69.chr1.g3306.t1.cds n=1 Tax=Oikopleura dioica TaxID=34765 RepID=A0ABN7T2W9_OIKDI|nr:Oidioi.mRNA.OKI2018_I69.chr1.g3306.t1.cds [Oikopleura dioica]
MQHSNSAKILFKELQQFNESPIEGFRIIQVDESNIYDWQIAVFGPPGTPYEGGYFKAHIRFPGNYPFSPPTFRFLTKIWHPNIYENGEVCISILHPPVDDVQGGELPGERWNPTQSVRTILLSIISVLNDPNTFSPANVDASVAYRNWKEGKNTKYPDHVRAQVVETQKDAERDGVTIPTTSDEYCVTSNNNTNDDIMDDEEFDYDDDYDDDDESNCPADYSFSSGIPSQVSLTQAQSTEMLMQTGSTTAINEIPDEENTS